MKRGKPVWVTRDREPYPCLFWKEKPKYHKGLGVFVHRSPFAHHNRDSMSPELFESLFGIVIGPGECKRVRFGAEVLK